MILDLVAGVTPRTERHPPFLGAGCQVFNGIRWCSQDRLAEHHSRRPGLTTERTRCKFAINHYYLSSASCEKMLHEMFGSVWHRALRSDLFIHQPTVSSTARSTILLHPPTSLPPSHFFHLHSVFLSIPHSRLFPVSPFPSLPVAIVALQSL